MRTTRELPVEPASGSRANLPAGAKSPASLPAAGASMRGTLGRLDTAEVPEAVLRMPLRQLQMTVGNAGVAAALGHVARPVQRVGEGSAALGFDDLQGREDRFERAEPPAIVRDKDVTPADRAEFRLLKGQIADPDAKAYVKHRNQVFGSRDAYMESAAESDAELERGRGTRKDLRTQIELQGEAQTIFYRWVRRAYVSARVEDIPALILARETPELKAAVAAVEKLYVKPFARQGFNPRPQKNARLQYVLGTLSDHALGTAIDIEPERNRILSPGEWKFIEQLTGMKIDRSHDRWKKTPEDLWRDVRDLNAAFVREVREAEAAGERRAALRLAAGRNELTGPRGQTHDESYGTPADPKEPRATNPLDELFAGQPKLRASKDGFFALEWDLVKALHEEKFRWGVTFPNADLHHFELEPRAKPPPDP